MAKKTDKDTQKESQQQPMMPDMGNVNAFNDTMDQMRMAPDSVKNLTKSFDGFSSGMERLTKSMDTLNNNFEKTAKDTSKRSQQSSRQATQSPAQAPFQADAPKQSGTPRSTQSAQPPIQSKRFEHYMDNLANRQQQQAPPQPMQPQQRSYAPANERYSTARGTRPHVGGQVGANIGSDFNKNLLQMGHMMSPMSFMQYSLMFGAGFPLQMKMAESITRPVTDVSEKFEVGRSFAGGFTGVGDAVGGFTQQLAQSPFNMYESMYQSKILLTSALGGERQSNKAITTALDMAREYPVKTEQVLSSLSRLAVYPQTKPYLKNEDFQKKLMESVSGLSLIVPEQGMEGAMFSLIEAMSGSWRSLQMRFNVSPEVVESLSGMSKGEMSSDPNKLIEGLHRFIGKSVGLDVLEKQKYTFSKQVDNFGDSLQMMTRNVFEQTGLYKTITAGATTFQTGFSSLAENKTFLNFIGNLTQPFQERTDNAMAKFVGMPTGLFKQSPLSQITKVLEENFEGMSYEEIGGKFSTLIDDMGGIWKDTNKDINKIINSAFGKTLGDIGGDIADVVGSNFQGMAMAVIGAFGKTMLENPMDIAMSVGTLAMPVMGVIGGAQLGVGMAHKFFSEKTIGRRVMQGSDALFGTHKFRTSSMMSGPVLNEEKLGAAIQKSATKDADINNMLFSKGEGKDFDGQFRNRDTGPILKRIADIGEENRVALGKNLTDTSKGRVKFSREEARATKGRIGDSPIPLTKNQTNKFNSAVERLAVSTLGLEDAGKTSPKTIAKVSDAAFKKSDLFKEMTAEGTDLGNLMKSSVPNKFRIARNVITEQVYSGVSSESRDVFSDTDISKRPDYVSSLKGQPRQNFVNAEIGKLTSALEERGASVRKGILGNVKEIDIDAKTVNILEGALGQKVSGQATLPSKADVRASYAKYKDTDEFKNLSTGDRRDVRKAMFRYEDALSDPQRQTWYSRGGTILDENYGMTQDMINEIVDPVDIKKLQKGLGGVEFAPNSFKHMMGVLGDEKNIAAIGGDLVKGGGTIGEDLLQNKSFYRFVTDRQGWLEEAAKAGTRGAATMSDDVLRGGKAFGQVLGDSNIGGRLATGGKRFAPLRLAAKAGNLPFFQDLRKSGAMRKLAPAAAGALALADIPFSMFQSHQIAKNFGKSDGSAMNYALATGGAGLGALGLGAGAIAKYGGEELTTKGAIGRLLGMNNAAKSAGKGFLQRGLASGAGIAGLTGIVGAFESVSAYSDSFKKLEDSQEKYSNSLLQYGLKNKEYSQLLATGGVPGLTFKSAFAKDERREQGYKGIADNKWMIGLGTGIAALATVLTGGGALAVGGAALAAGGTGALSSYLYGTGNLNEEERYTQQSITGFLGNRKFFTDRSREMGKDIDYLQSKEQSTGLTFAETARLRNLQVDKAKIDVLASATLEGAKEVSNIVTGKDSFIDQRKGEDRPRGIFNRAQRYTDEERNILGYSQQLGQRSGRTAENKIGAYLSAQSYVMDQYNPKVKKVFEEGSEKEVIGQSKRYAEVLDAVNAQYDDTMGSVNIKDTNQVEIMKQAKTSFIKSIQVPLGNTEAQANVRDAVTPMLFKDFFKANTMSVLTEDKAMQNSYAEIAVASQNKLAQLGIGDPNKLFTDTFKQWNDDTPATFGNRFDQTDFNINRQDTIGGRGLRRDAKALADKSFKGFDGVLGVLGIESDNIGTAQLAAMKNLSRENFNTATGFGAGDMSDREYERYQKGIQRYESSPQAKIIDRVRLPENERVAESYNLDFIEKLSGIDISAGDAPTSDNAIFDIIKRGDAQRDARQEYISGGGSAAGFNQFIKTLKAFKGSDVVGKKDFYTESRNTAFGDLMDQSDGFRELKPVQRRFDILKDFKFEGYSQGRSDEIGTNVSRAFKAKDTMLNFRSQVMDFVAKENIAGVSRDGEYDRDERAKILATDGGAELLTKYSKSADDYDKAMQVVNNATQATSEAVEGKLGQSIEKVGVLFKETATAGDALSGQAFTNRLKEQNLSSQDAIASLRSTSAFKTASAESKFDALKNEGVDFAAIGRHKKVQANITSMADLMQTDESGRTVLSKIGNLENRGGMTGEQFDLLGRGATEYKEAQLLLPDAAAQAFQHQQKMGQQIAGLTMGQNPFYQTAMRNTGVSYGNRRSLVTGSLKDLSVAVAAFNKAKSPEERAKITPVIDAIQKTLGGAKVSVQTQAAHVNKMLGQTGANGAFQQFQNTVTDDTLATQRSRLAEALGYDTSDNPNLVADVGAAQMTPAMKKAAQKTGGILADDSFELKKKKLGLSNAVTYADNKQTGEREFFDKDGKRIGAPEKDSKDTKTEDSEKGIKISNGGEIASLIANAITSVLSGTLAGGPGGGTDQGEVMQRNLENAVGAPIADIKNVVASNDGARSARGMTDAHKEIRDGQADAPPERKPLTENAVNEFAGIKDTPVPDKKEIVPEQKDFMSKYMPTPIGSKEHIPTAFSDSFGTIPDTFMTMEDGVKSFTSGLAARDGLGAGQFSADQMQIKEGVASFRELSQLPTTGTAVVERANQQRNETEAVVLPETQAGNASPVTEPNQEIAALNNAHAANDFAEIQNRLNPTDTLVRGDLYPVSDQMVG